MKKGIVIVLVATALAAALIASSWTIGAKTREGLAERVEAVNRDGLLTLSIESYRQGLFTSEAVIKADLPVQGGGAESAANRLVFDIRAKFAHGPLPLAGGAIKPALAVVELKPAARPDSTRELRALLEAFPPEKGPVTRLVFGFDGGGDFEQEIPALKKTVEGDKPLNVDWKGLTARGVFGPDFSSVKGEAKSEGLELRDEEARAALRGVDASWDLRLTDNGLFLGKTVMSMQYVGMTFLNKGGEGKPAQGEFALRDFSTKTSTTESGDLLQAEANVAAAGVTAPAYAFGPVEVGYVLRNIDKAAVADWRNEMAALQPRMSTMTPEQVQSAVASAGERLLPKFLARSPEFEMTALRAKSPDGDVDGRFKLAMVNPDGRMVNNPLQIMGMLQAEANLNMAETLARKLALQSVSKGETPADADTAAFAASLADEQLDELVRNGLIVREGGVCRSAASWKDGKLMLNGRATPLL